MARIIHPERQNTPAAGIGCSQWGVRGAICDNAAAKFWSSLFDEVLFDYPFRTTITLSVATGGGLSRDDLHPTRGLERDLAALAGKDLRQVYREALTMLEITGPPTSTTVRLTQTGHGHPFLTVMLALPDAEIIPFLFAWLLEWQDLPSDCWNDACVDGEFVADDLRRHRRYEVHCQLTSRHLSEGLYLREATLQAGCSTKSPRL